AALAQPGQPVVTRIGFNANQFVLMSGSGDTQYSPFAVVNGQVFISDAFIQNGSITSAKIANAAINNAKISGSIWSEGYKVANQGGWCLSKADNNLSFTGPEGRLYVQIGKLTGVAPNV
ncbi:phage tail tip fiber protein, partial [Citrobacter freundii]|uniref:phage tail tip fiber protein n=1 Tax=Citrobacter freundii TaxID=546 RepID=UPI002B27B522